MPTEQRDADAPGAAPRAAVGHANEVLAARQQAPAPRPVADPERNLRPFRSDKDAELEQNRVPAFLPLFVFCAYFAHS